MLAREGHRPAQKLTDRLAEPHAKLGWTGTGAALARTFASSGYHVALLARKQDSLSPVEEDVKRAGGQATSFPTDVSDASSVRDTFSSIAKLPGSVSCAIFNASGSFVMKPFLEVPVEALEQSLKVSS